MRKISLHVMKIFAKLNVYIKPIFIIIFLINSLFVSSQTVLEAIVKDLENGEPLIYCNVQLNGENQGAITNLDGRFKLKVNIEKDSLVFSFIGYETQVRACKDVIIDKEVLMSKKKLLLDEITIIGDKDYIYEILNNCRKKIYNYRSVHTSKVYYGVNSQNNGSSIELVECYYNSDISGIKINDLHFRNGRIGLNPEDESVFFTLNTSKAITLLDLVEHNVDFPFNPLCYAKRKMKTYYDVKMINRGEDFYHIRFEPLSENNDFFSGEIWIDKKTNNLLKIDLEIKNSKLYPFKPIFPSDSISNISLKISNNYKINRGEIIPDYFSFDYSFDYHSNKKLIGDNFIRGKKSISSNSIMYFYDYGKPFILPYFEFSEDLNDYSKMSIIPYNKVFWENNEAFLLTKLQKEDLDFFVREGYVYNYGEGNFGKNFLDITLTESNANHIFGFYYPFWSEKDRLKVNNISNKVNYTDADVGFLSKNSYYRFKAQILLDVVLLPDSVYHVSYTVFDPMQSFYYLKNFDKIDIVLNIYFYICEVKRREMEEKLQIKGLTADQIDYIYKSTLKEIEDISQVYFYEVDIGKDEKALKKWNRYILEKLKINNMLLIFR